MLKNWGWFLLLKHCHNEFMDLALVTEKIQGKMNRASHIQARVKFDFGDDGILFIDSTQSPPLISHEDQEADTTLSCSIETLMGFMSGTHDPTMAFMMGKLKVQGSMGLAMKLNAILED